MQSDSHGPATQCTAEAHHSANYDQASPCRHGKAANGKSLFSHTRVEAMGARWRADEMSVRWRVRCRTLAATGHAVALPQTVYTVALNTSHPPSLSHAHIFWSIMGMLSIKFAPTESSYLSLL